MPIQMPPSPMDWEEGMNKNNSPDYLQFKDKPGKDVVIPGPSDPWGASEIIGTRTNQLSRKEATAKKGSISGMRKRLTSDTLDTQRRLKVAGKIIDIATRMAGPGAVDDEILRIASKLKAGLSEGDVEEMHSQIARIASESGRVAFDETAIDDDGAQKQPEPTETENYVKIVRGPVDSSVQMSLKGKTDVRQPTASRRVADDQFQQQFDPQQFGPSEEDDEFGDEDGHESFEDDDEFDDMNDEDGLDGDEDDDFSFGGDDDDDSVEDMNAGMPLSEIDMEDGMSEMNGLGDDDGHHQHEGEEGPEIVDEEEVMDDGEDLGSEENFIDDSGEVDELGDLSMIDEDGAFNSDDFLSDDDEGDDFSAGMGMGNGGGMGGETFASLEDSQILASMGIETGAESAGVLSHRALPTHPSAGGGDIFRGRQARRRQVNIAERGEFSVWETENDPELVAERMKGNRRRAAKQPQARQQQPVRHAAAPKPRPAQSRQARRQAPQQQQQFRPSRVRTSSRRPEASQNVFDQMFSVPNVDKFFEH